MTKKNTPMFKLITGAAAISAGIDSMERRGKKLDRDIQILALSAMQHHVEHGDTTLINRLVAAMPKGSRVNALRTFIETFGAVIYDADDKAFKHSRTKTLRLDEAMAVMWTEFKPEAEYTPITDPAGMVKALVARLEKDIKEMGDKSTVEPALLDSLRNATVPAILH